MNVKKVNVKMDVRGRLGVGCLLLVAVCTIGRVRIEAAEKATIKVQLVNAEKSGDSKNPTIPGSLSSYSKELNALSQSMGYGAFKDGGSSSKSGSAGGSIAFTLSDYSITTKIISAGGGEVEIEYEVKIGEEKVGGNSVKLKSGPKLVQLAGSKIHGFLIFQKTD